MYSSLSRVRLKRHCRDKTNVPWKFLVIWAVGVVLVGVTEPLLAPSAILLIEHCCLWPCGNELAMGLRFGQSKGKSSYRGNNNEFLGFEMVDKKGAKVGWRAERGAC